MVRTIARPSLLLSALMLAGVLASPGLAAEPVELSTDVCIVGGGSGGYSAAIAASRAGAECVGHDYASAGADLVGTYG